MAKMLYRGSKRLWKRSFAERSGRTREKKNKFARKLKRSWLEAMLLFSWCCGRRGRKRRKRKRRQSASASVWSRRSRRMRWLSARLRTRRLRKEEEAVGENVAGSDRGRRPCGTAAHAHRASSWLAPARLSALGGGACGGRRGVGGALTSGAGGRHAHGYQFHEPVRAAADRVEDRRGLPAGEPAGAGEARMFRE
eukprot:629556-Hanusia_phi.AAC.2